MDPGAPRCVSRKDAPCLYSSPDNGLSAGGKESCPSGPQGWQFPHLCRSSLSRSRAEAPYRRSTGALWGANATGDGTSYRLREVDHSRCQRSRTRVAFYREEGKVMSSIVAPFLRSDFMLALANHLLQSTLFAAVAALVAMSLRKNQARTRYWIWLAASVKFVVPFFLFISLGRWLAVSHPSSNATQSASLYAIDVASQPFTFLPSPAPAEALGTSAHNSVSSRA